MKQINTNDKNMMFLLLGRTTSLFGSSIYLIALPLYILQLTNDLAKSGLFFALASIPSIICAPFLGIFIEKINRKYCIIACDICTSIIYFTLLFLNINAKAYFIILLIASMLINIISSAFDISSKVLFTEVTTEETITNYNGIKSFCDNLSAVTAPIIGTFLFGSFGFNAILLTIGICYGLSAIQECMIRYTKSSTNSEEVPASFIKQLGDGIHFIVKRKDIFKVFALVMVLNFFVANNDEIINPGILIQKYNVSEKIYGITSSFLILGTLIASLFIFKNKKFDLNKSIKSLFITNSILMVTIGGVSLLLNAMYSNGYLMFFAIMQVLIGFITTCINISLGSYFQINIPVNYQARFFALLSFSSRLLIPLGIAYTGCLSSYLAADVTYIINNVCVISVTLFIFVKNPFEK